MEQKWGWSDAFWMLFGGLALATMFDIYRFGRGMDALDVIGIHAFIMAIGSGILGSVPRYRRSALRALPYFSSGLGAGAGLGALLSGYANLFLSIGIGLTGALVCLGAAWIGWRVAASLKKPPAKL